MLANDAYNFLIRFRNGLGLDEPIQFGETLVSVGKQSMLNASYNIIFQTVERLGRWAIVVFIAIVGILRRTAILSLEPIQVLKNKSFKLYEIRNGPTAVACCCCMFALGRAWQVDERSFFFGGGWAAPPSSDSSLVEASMVWPEREEIISSIKELVGTK